MERSFHYYGTYCAALIAGYSIEESQELCYSAFLVDKFSKTFLSRIGGPESAATTQLPVEMASARVDPIGLADITRIWASFHFLPADLHAKVNKGNRRYRNKYRLICGPNGDLLVDTVNLAQGKGLQAVGLAMHVLADTWAHRYFAGTPSLVNHLVAAAAKWPCRRGMRSGHSTCVVWHRKAGVLHHDGAPYDGWIVGTVHSGNSNRYRHIRRRRNQ